MHLCKSTKPETPSTCVGVPQNYSGEPLGINFTVPVEDPLHVLTRQNLKHY